MKNFGRAANFPIAQFMGGGNSVSIPNVT